MEAKSTPREKTFVPGTSRKRVSSVTLLRVARDKAQLLEMGARIKELREASGYKQEYVADYVGVDKRTYQFWQQGKHPPSQEKLEKLSELFGVTPKFILRGETPDLHDNGVVDYLRRIEQRIAHLEQALAPRPPAEPATAEELLAELRRSTRVAEQILGKLGRDVGRRDLQSRRATDQSPERASTG